MGNTSSKEFELLSMGMLCFYSAGSSEQYISISSSGRFLHLSSDEGSIPFKSFKLNKDFRVQDEIPDKNSFIISYGSDKKTFVLRMENTEQFQTWKNYFKSLSRPSWDEKGSQFCKVCAKEFNLFRRQHHCRKCGKVICRKHGNKKIWLRELGYNSKQRVCIACFN